MAGDDRNTIVEVHPRGTELIKGTRMVEVLAPVMQRQYRETMTIVGWNGFLCAAERMLAPA